MCEVIDNIPISSLSLDECRRDSPQFRYALTNSERELLILQNKYLDCATACRRMVDDGTQYYKSMRIFIDTIEGLKPCFSDNDKVQDGATKCLKILSEFREQGIFLLDRFSEAEIKLLSFHQELKKLSETKRYFEKASDDLDDAMGRSLAIAVRPKHPIDTEEADNMTDACRKSFLHVSIDYVRQIRSLRLSKNSHLLETLLRVISAGIKEYHHQGWDFMNRVDIWSEHIRQQIEFAKGQAEEERRRMDTWQRSVFGPAESPGSPKKDGDSAVTNDNTNSSAVDGAQGNDEVKMRGPKLSLISRQSSSSAEVKMSGYLFRKTAKKLAKTWVRRWFVLTNNQLKYCKRSEPGDWINLENDLRICTAKPVDPVESTSRRFSFLLIAPDRTHLLQAESQEEMRQWVNAFQAGIHAQMNTFRRQSTPASSTVESAVPTSASASALHLAGGRQHNAGIVRASMGPTFNALTSRNGGNSDGRNPTDTLTPGFVENRLKKEYRANKERACRLIRSLPANDKCCECGAESKWASVNLGITLCVECSGGHRGLGVHLSKVKSLLLDEWGPEPLRVMTSLGNAVVNRVYEGAYYQSEDAASKLPPRLKPMSTRDMRDSWIRAKWLERRFVVPLALPEIVDLLTIWQREQQQKQQNSQTTQPVPSPKLSDEESICSGTSGPYSGSEESIEQLAAELVQLSPDALLHRTAHMRCLPLMLASIAHGANPNWRDPDNLNATPLHRAVDSGSLAACEFLLLNGAQLNSEDDNGRSPLHYACLRQHKFQVTLFAKRCDLLLNARDNSGQKPLDLALETGNADIVTILRMLALNEASREDALGGDETVNDIFRDFRNRAYTEEDCDREYKSPALEENIEKTPNS